jgi:sigma-E factor negative regulatory protein RseB
VVTTPFHLDAAAIRLRSLIALALAGIVLSMLPVPKVWAQAKSAAAEPVAPASEVRAWLMRIHDAARHHNFQGTFVVSGGGTVSSARIAHYCEGPNQYERTESLDGQARQVYRHNDLVHTLWPAKHVALVERRNLFGSFPALLQTGDDRIVDSYDVHRESAERVAGHEANVLLLKPKDGLRYGYRLWADQASGLLLRADVLGDRNEVLETSAFSDVVIGVKPRPESVLQPMNGLEGYRVVQPVMTATRLEAQGWAMRQAVPGFRQVSCVKRAMEGPGPVESVDKQALQVIYADGLTYVSVFIEPWDARRHTRQMVASVGPTQTLMFQHGDWWITVVGDVPPATLRLFATGLERRQK